MACPNHRADFHISSMVQQVHSRIVRRDEPLHPDGVGQGVVAEPPKPSSSAAATLDADLPHDEGAYFAQRNALISTERLRRFDAVRRVQRTSKEEEADVIVGKLKASEQKTLWSSTDVRKNLATFKGAPWSVAKARGATKGQLYRLVQEMPKGAVLHCHLDGTTDAPWLIRRAVQESTLYMRATAPLSSHDTLYDHTIEIVFRQLPTAVGTAADGEFPREDGADIWSSEYTPNTWVPVSHARPTFPYDNIYEPPPGDYVAETTSLFGNSTSSAAAAFDAFLLSIVTLAPLPSHLGMPYNNSKVAWTRFLRTFGIIEGLMTHGIRRDYFVECFNTLIRDNVYYVEARVNFLSDKLIGPDMQDSLTRADMVRLVEEALSLVRRELPHGQLFDCKIIYSTVRFIDCAQVRKHVDNALELKQQFPDRIIGFDLVGWEDVGVTLKTYAPELLRLRSRAAELGVQLPLCLHAGETLGDGDAIDDNLYDAILLGTRRIGHAFSLTRHPVLMDIVRNRGICIESCPISSQMLGYIDSTAGHPVLAWLGHGLPVALSHDDPCQFLNAGLSPDFYQILSASDLIDLTSLGVLARNSLAYSLMPDSEQKEALLAQWDRQWTAFVDKVLAIPA